MLKRIFAFLMLFFSVSCVYSATVDVDIDILSDYTTFAYEFDFSENDSYSSFSFEKPEDAKIVSVLDESNKSVKYSVAGDYYIFRPDSTKGKKFYIEFTSESKSLDIFNKNSFSSYANFNFPVDVLVYEIGLERDLRNNVIEFFPRDYTVTEDGDYQWEVSEVERDTLFLLEFEPNGVSDKKYSNLKTIFAIVVIVLLLVIASILGYFYAKRKKKSSKKEEKKKSSEKIEEDKKESGEKEKEDKKKEAVKEESYEEITSKYLTENEKDVVDVIRDNNGISQYDILNYLPSLSKSNLSKIITKLNNKKILSRIRVGKVNKIYLGERLEGKVESSENKSDSDD